MNKCAQGIYYYNEASNGADSYLLDADSLTTGDHGVHMDPSPRVGRVAAETGWTSDQANHRSGDNGEQRPVSRIQNPPKVQATRT